MGMTHGPRKKVQCSLALDWEWREPGCGENAIIYQFFIEIAK